VEYDEIRKCLVNCRFTDHARRKMEAESFGTIRVEEIMQALDSGEIIEEYPEDVPYPSCLVLGRTATGRPNHVVCAPAAAEQRVIIITTYQPDPAQWDEGFRHRRQP